MRIGIGILIGLCLTLQVIAQPNLVPNPSFEAHNYCPYSVGISMVSDWERVRGSIDYYHECGTDGFSIPTSWGGGGYALSGQAYIGLAIKHMSEFAPEFREYVGVSLTSPLVAGANYRVVFHVSFGDSLWYAGKNIGAHLSVGMPEDDITSLLSLNADVRYEGEEFLTDKEGWTRIGGIYLAQGGENFLTIGNFDPDSLSETVFVEGGAVPMPNTPDYWKAVYYFIDDVSVIDVDSLVGVVEREASSVSIYPNPAIGFFTVETPQGSGATLRLLDMAGREVLSMPLHSSRQSINVQGIPAGVYVAVVEQQGAVVGRRKMLIQR